MDKKGVTTEEILEDYAQCDKEGAVYDCMKCSAQGVCPLLTRYKEKLKEGINDLIDKYNI